jgi:hypothetical protein
LVPDDIPRAPVRRLSRKLVLIRLSPSVQRDRSEEMKQQRERHHHSSRKGETFPVPLRFTPDDQIRHRLPLLEPFSPEERLLGDEPRVQQMVDVPDRVRPALFALNMEIENFLRTHRWGGLTFLATSAVRSSAIMCFPSAIVLL